MPSEVKIVPHGSPEYKAAVELRRQVLRLPLGLDFTPEQLAAEKGEVHLAMFDQDNAIACLSLVVDGDDAKMRQVAVSPEIQGAGTGRQMVEASEAVARERGFGKMVLHARQTAVPFYERLGYQVEGDPFEEVGIPHRKMSKNLRS